MPRRIPIIELKDILERLRWEQSIKGIKRELKRHKTVIRKVKRIAEENIWLDSQSPMPSEKQLKKVHESSDDGQKRSHPLYAYTEDIEGWLKEGHSYLVMHRLLSKRIACSESTVRRYVQRRFPPPLSPVMIRKTVPGEVMGVPVKVTPDNLKAAIVRTSFEDPLVNRVYRSLAEHYGFMISPCVPCSPEHKGGVEMKYVKRNFLPLFK